MKKIAITITNDQLEKIKKLYDISKKSQPNLDISFDEFIEKIIINSLNTHLQFSEMNENMNKMLKNITDTMGDFKVDDALKDFDSMVQEIFKSNVENKENQDTKKNSNDDNKKIKN